MIKSPKSSYDALLFHMMDNLGERDLNKLEFTLRSDISKPVLESRNLLKWFSELEKRCLLSPDNLGRLEDFLELASLNVLLEDVHRFQAKRRIVVFYQKSVEAKIPELCLDEKFEQSWTSSEGLSQDFQKECQDLFHGINNATLTMDELRSLLNKGVQLLVNNFPCCDDLDLHVAMKIVYLSDIVFKKFGGMIVEQMDLVKDFFSEPRRLPLTVPRPDKIEILLLDIKQLLFIILVYLVCFFKWKESQNYLCQ